MEYDETENVDSKYLYEEAENLYSKRARRYIFSWVGIVCLYAVILLIEPVNDMVHGQMIASNWTTLFKKV